MEPKVNLKDPFVKTVLERIQEHDRLAFLSAQRLQNAIHPIYKIEREKAVPKQVGSCVFLNARNQILVLTASHVFDALGKTPFIVGCGNKLHTFGGDRYSTARGPSGTHQDDPLDASVFRLDGQLSATVRESSLSMSDLDQDHMLEVNSTHVAMGFFAKRSSVENNTAHSELAIIPSIEHYAPEYLALGIDRLNHAAIAYDGKVVVGEEWRLSPIPAGMSGGAILRIPGFPVGPVHQSAPVPTAKLTAIITEHRTAQSGKPPAMLGTRINVHLNLIKKHFPDLQ